MFFRMIMLLVVGAALTGCAASTQTASAPTTQPAEASASGEVIAADGALLVVHGLSCPLCAENVGKSLQQVAGVASVDRDLGRGQWAVTFEPGHSVTRADLGRAITRAGFTLVNIEPMSKASAQ